MPGSDLDPIEELETRAFGRYQLFAKLGSGGQADVYLAIARGTLGIAKLVVIKRAKPAIAADPALLGIFVDEARLTLRLNHPNLAHTYEVGEEQGAHFISMEHVAGLSLIDLFRCPRTRSFAPAIWLRIIADALSGLQHAHGLRDYDGKPLGIVHCDISPHNIVVSYDGVTKLLDFGIAKASLNSATTELGIVRGKVAYMAPEQTHGEVDRRSDLFAMGVVLWEMLSGRRLFEGESHAILQRLVHAPIPRLRSVLPEIDPELDAIVARALEKDPAARYQSANEMRQTIERYLRTLGQVVREVEVGEAISTAFHDRRAALEARIQQAMAGIPNEAPPARPRRRKRGLVSVGALGCVALLAIGVGKLRGTAPATSAPARAPCTAPIRVRVMYDMTGATREVGTAAGKGEYDYLRAINEAGGIRGCKLDIDVQDTRYDKHAALEVYGAWKARPEWSEVSTIFLQGTPITQALGRHAADDEKVIISGAYAGELAAPAPTTADVEVPLLNGAFAEASVRVRKQSPGYPYVFFQGTDYTTAARVAANFAWRQGARRMAFFYCSTSTFCTDPVDGAKTFLKQLGGTQIGRDLFIELDDDEQAIGRKVSEFFRQERLYKAAHPDYEMVDWIWFGNTNTNSVSLGKALEQARTVYKVDVHAIGNNWSVDESLYRRCGDACVGFSVVQPFAMFGDLTIAGTARLLADHATYRKVDREPADAYRTVEYVYGRVAVATWKIAVERLIDRGMPVTGPNLRAMLESFRDVDVEDFAAITYTATDHRPQSGARVARIGAHGQLEMIGQPLALSLQSGWLGW